MARDTFCRGCEQTHDPLKPCPVNLALKDVLKVSEAFLRQTPVKSVLEVAGELGHLRARLAEVEADKAAQRAKSNARVKAWRERNKR